MTPREAEYHARAGMLAHIVISPGLYHWHNGRGPSYTVLSIEDDKATLRNETTGRGVISIKTLHWCRKQLVRASEAEQPTCHHPS